MYNSLRSLTLVLLLLSTVAGALAQKKPRARDLGVPFDGTPGPWNAITDVSGVEVGYSTIIRGEGKLVVGKGPVRTGVTAIFPKGKKFRDRVFGAWFTLNGNGEMTGTTWLEESGSVGSPILITNTHSVGVVRDAVIEWGARQGSSEGYSGDFSLPVVAETWDGFLNDINGFHVKKEHAFEAMDRAASGPVAEGNVGGGTGMIAHGFKGGTGTSSRKLDEKSGGYTVGVLVQANYGSRELLRIAGVPVGKEIQDPRPERGKPDDGSGSIIVVVATDAPLLPHQLKRIVTRVALGIGVMGGRGENSSGDIFIAFSTANPEIAKTEGLAQLTMLPNERIGPLFRATVDATEEAIVNAMVAAETMAGRDGNKAPALPHDRLRQVLKKYSRLQEKPTPVIPDFFHGITLGKSGIQQSMQTKEGHFVQGLGLTSATTIVMGGMIGSGIFIVSADIARMVDSPALLLGAWIITGIMTIIAALAYGELAAMMPQAGGQYVYLREALGPLSGFLYGWTLFLVIQTGTAAAVAVGFGKFLGVFFPSISSQNWIWHIAHIPPIPIGPVQLGNMDVGINTQNLTAIIVIGILTAINVFGVKLGALVQNIFTFAKTAAVIGLVGLGLFIGQNAEAVSANFGNFWVNAGLDAKHAVHKSAWQGLSRWLGQ